MQFTTKEFSCKTLASRCCFNWYHYLKKSCRPQSFRLNRNYFYEQNKNITWIIKSECVWSNCMKRMKYLYAIIIQVSSSPNCSNSQTKRLDKRTYTHNLTLFSPSFVDRNLRLEGWTMKTDQWRKTCHRFFLRIQKQINSDLYYLK